MFLDLHLLRDKETHHRLVFRVGENGENLPRLNTTSVTSLSFFFFLVLTFAIFLDFWKNAVVWVVFSYIIFFLSLVWLFPQLIKLLLKERDLGNVRKEGWRVLGGVSATSLGGSLPGRTPECRLYPGEGQDTPQRKDALLLPHFSSFYDKTKRSSGAKGGFQQHQLANKKMSSSFC